MQKSRWTKKDETLILEVDTSRRRLGIAIARYRGKRSRSGFEKAYFR